MSLGIVTRPVPAHLAFQMSGPQSSAGSTTYSLRVFHKELNRLPEDAMETETPLEHASEVGGPNDEQGVVFYLQHDIVEDIPAEIEEFVRLSRFGLAADAKILFDCSLKEHLNLFPVLAEYADFLLDQDDLGAMKECSELLSGYLASSEAFSEDEVQLLQLLGAFSDLKVRGNQARESAIATARSWRRGFTRTDSKFDMVDRERDEVEIQGLEIYLAIMADTCRATPSWLENEDYFIPGTQKEPIAGWGAFESWCHILNKEQRPWEAQKVLKSLLGVLGAGCMHQFYSECIETLERFNQGDAYSFSRIAAANNYVAVSVKRATSLSLPNRVRAEHEEAHALLLLFRDRGALQGNHFEQWKRNSSKLREFQGGNKDSHPNPRGTSKLFSQSGKQSEPGKAQEIRLLKRAQRAGNDNVLGVSRLRHIRQEAPPVFLSSTFHEDDPDFSPQPIKHIHSLPISGLTSQSASAHSLASGPAPPTLEDSYRFFKMPETSKFMLSESTLSQSTTTTIPESAVHPIHSGPQLKEVPISITPFGQGTFKTTAVCDSDSPCCIMSSTFLERIGCLERMMPESATHSFGSRPHDCVGVFVHRIRLLGKGVKTYVGIFCVVEEDEEGQPVRLGKEFLETLSGQDQDLVGMLTSERVREEGNSVRPILPGRQSQEDRKASEEQNRKRKN